MLFSLVDESTIALSEKLQELKTEAVLFAAGATPGPDMDKNAQAVDHQGAIKSLSTQQTHRRFRAKWQPDPAAYQALQLASIKRVLVISSVDVRDITQPPPSYYSAADLEASKWIYSGCHGQLHRLSLTDLASRLL